MNIVLLGYRGSGKTTVGRQLAARQWLTFVDLDDEVRKQFDNKSIADIWSQYGESRWRRAEVEVTQQLLGQTRQVIALGGGTLMEPAARRAVLEASETIRIYLMCEAEELYRRISEDPSTEKNRPHLTDFGGSVDEIRTVLSKRDPVYRSVADRVLNVTHLRLDNTLRYLIEKCL